MRAVLLLTMLLVILPGVFAAGIGVPENLDVIERMDVGDEETFTFMLSASSTEEDIQFFIVPLTGNGGTVTFNGADEYTKNYNLEPYEKIFIDVDMEAVEGGTEIVQWGYRYITPVEGGEGFPIEQAIMKKFRVVVDGFESDDEEVDVEVNVDDSEDDSTDAASGGAGGGGGAGGALLENDEVPDAGDVVMQDISGSDSPTTTKKVRGIDDLTDEEKNMLTDAQREQLFGLGASESLETNGSSGGKLEFTLVVIFTTLTAGLSFMSYRAVKEDEE